MCVVRRDNGDKVDALVFGQTRLGFCHRFVIWIDPFWIESEIFAGKPRLFSIGRKSSGYQINLTIEPGCHPMNCADKCVSSASDHSHSYFTCHSGFPGSYFSRSKAASKACRLGVKSYDFTFRHDSEPPCTRSIRMSSHSIESGPL